jgi:Xaa-Pro aminopeptidase
MQSDNLDAIVVFGSASDPAFSYLTDGADVNDAMFTKTRNGTANIWLGFLEREGVKNPDFRVQIFDRALYERVFSETNSRELAELEISLKGLGFLRGGNKRVAIYGRLEFSFSGLLRNELKKRYPELEIVDDQIPTLIDRLRATKSDEELAKIIEVGHKTSRVMIETRDFIRSHMFRKDVFIKPDDVPLTVGDVKRFARLKLFENDLEDIDGMIFAPGKQGTVGHNTGEPDTPITLGEPIIFDLFPRGTNGYYHDETRTWCFGHVSDDIQSLYDDVLGCFNFVKKEAVSGIPTGTLQELACDYFRERGHPVVKDNPELTDGYNHSLGHGVGLAVHEPPFIGIGDKEKLSVGNVFTLEPGLYYTKPGLAVRIEDTLYIDSEGNSVSITEVPYDLLVAVE